MRGGSTVFLETGAVPVPRMSRKRVADTFDTVVVAQDLTGVIFRAAEVSQSTPTVCWYSARSGRHLYPTSLTVPTPTTSEVPRFAITVSPGCSSRSVHSSLALRLTVASAPLYGKCSRNASRKASLLSNLDRSPTSWRSILVIVVVRRDEHRRLAGGIPPLTDTLATANVLTCA